MLRKYISLLLVLALLLVGCEVPAVPDPTDETTLPPETTGAAEPAPETKAVPAPPPAMDAESLFWKMSMAINGKRANQYRLARDMLIRTGDYESQTVTDMTVKIAAAPLAVYAESRGQMKTKSAGMNLELTQTTQTYVQMEEGTPVTYIHSDQDDSWIRYEEIVQPSKILTAYSYGVTLTRPPEVMSVDTGAQIIDGRETYVLRCTLTPMEYFGEEAEGLEISMIFYIDTEVYVPLRIEIDYLGMDVILSEALASIIGEMGLEGNGDVTIDCLEYREIITGLCYDPVEVPAVPEEGIRKSVDISGENTEL